MDDEADKLRETQSSLMKDREVATDAGCSLAHTYRTILPHLERVQIGRSVRYTRRSWEQFKMDRMAVKVPA